MADGVHGALIRHVPKPVEAEHRKERGNVIILLLQMAEAIALAMLKIPVDVIRNHAQVDVTNEIDYFSSFDVTLKLIQHYVKQTSRFFSRSIRRNQFSMANMKLNFRK